MPIRSHSEILALGLQHVTSGAIHSTINLLSLLVDLLFPEYHIIIHKWNDSLYGLLHLAFSLSIVIWDSSMLHGSEVHSLLLLNNFPVHVCTSLFIHSPAEGPLSCFQFAAIRNKITINIHVCMFNLTRNYQTVFQSDCTIFFSF